MTTEDDLHAIFGGDISTEGIDPTKAGTGASELFETGVYDFVVERAELKDTKASDGKLVSVMFRHADSNAVLWQNYNIHNKSDRAEEIGRRELKKLAIGVGFDAVPKSPADFVNRPCTLAVKKQETRDSKSARRRKPDVEPMFENTITSYKAEKGAAKPTLPVGTSPDMSKVNF